MKLEQEITVNVNINKNDLIKFLETNNYNKIDSYEVDDIYFVKNETDFKQKTLDVLKKCVLIRTINKTKHYLVHKYKEYDENENIIKQGKTQVQVYNLKDAQDFLKEIGYKELIYVNDSVEVYEKDGLELCVEQVNDKYLYIEAEENAKYNTIEKMIKALEDSNIDYDKSNYYVKKAKMIFEDTYK